MWLQTTLGSEYEWHVGAVQAYHKIDEKEQGLAGAEVYSSLN